MHFKNSFKANPRRHFPSKWQAAPRHFEGSAPRGGCQALAAAAAAALPPAAPRARQMRACGDTTQRADVT